MFLFQDGDGCHIKGLLMNFFEKYFRELLKMSTFMQDFTTPLVSVSDYISRNKSCNHEKFYHVLVAEAFFVFVCCVGNE